MSAIPVKIKLNPVGKSCEIIVGDKDITKHVQTVDIQCAAGEVTVIRLTMINVKVDFSDDAEIIENVAGMKIEDITDGGTIVDITNLGSTYHDREVIKAND